MFQFRVTKYDPAQRDVRGAYRRDEWISIRDIGRVFGDNMLTEVEYQRVEDAYVNSALAFMQEAEISSLAVALLENKRATPLTFADGSILAIRECGRVVRQMLREQFWCKLEGERVFIHIGWDYYMYIGVPRECGRAQAFARELGLFVESFPSPYY
jgi:hypothetical protein